MYKKVIVIFSLMIACFCYLMLRIFYLTQTDSMAQAASRQSSYRLPVATTRGTIYDCSLRPLVNQSTHPVAAVMPQPDNITELLGHLTPQGILEVTEQIKNLRPFVTEVTDSHIYAPDLDVFLVPDRYAYNQAAPHIVGYVDGSGQGVAGIEASYDSLLREYGGTSYVTYEVDAAGHPIGSPELEVEDRISLSKGGVVLTIDSRIQEAAAIAASRYIDKGAVVVMEVHSGDIKAAVSLPQFTPNNLEDDLDNPDSPFLNRTMCAYSVGSVFKPLVAAAALTQGESESRLYECKGYAQVGDRIYYCHRHVGHGVLNMRQAIEQSCNPYFIDLVQDTGCQQILSLAAAVGFGVPEELAPGYETAAGTLPSTESLKSRGEQANFAFGQGELTATPIQLAQLYCTIANGGLQVRPRLVASFTEDGQSVYGNLPISGGERILDEAVAGQVASFLAGVVAEGTGASAQPAHYHAAGKTGSAQTGQMAAGPDGQEEEIIHAWFAGFYPVEHPQYAIVVLGEGLESGGDYAAPVFREIADRLYDLGLVG